MTRDFEYAAMRALAERIHRVVTNHDFNTACDVLMETFGLECFEEEKGKLVVYPHKSPRKNPACVVLCSVNYTMQDWRSLVNLGGTICYVYEAGNLKLAGDSKEPKVRQEAEDTALHT